MCVMSVLSILGLFGWGIYTAGKAAWENRLTIVAMPRIFTNSLKQHIKRLRLELTALETSFQELNRTQSLAAALIKAINSTLGISAKLKT